MDVCRLNFSHGNYEDHLKVIENVRILNKKLKPNIALLADLQGPKIRIGDVENNGININEGDKILFVNEKCIGTNEKVYLSYKNFASDVAIGDFILTQTMQKK